MANDFREGIRLEVDWKDAERTLKKLDNIVKNGFNKGLRETLNQIVIPKDEPSMREVAYEEMKKVYAVKTSRLQKNGKIELEKATVSKLSAAVITRGRPNSLTYFSYSPLRRPKKRGYTMEAQVLQRGNRSPLLPKAFLMTSKNGHMGIYSRPGPKKYKFRQYFGPGTSQMLYKKEVQENIEKEMLNRFDTAVVKAIDKVMDKAMK